MTAAAAQTDRQLTGDLSLDERIRQRAYELYVFRGDGTGSELDDWLQAEREVLADIEREKKPRTMRAGQGRSAA